MNMRNENNAKMPPHRRAINPESVTCMEKNAGHFLFTVKAQSEKHKTWIWESVFP